jgi:hypothetical protein
VQDVVTIVSQIKIEGNQRINNNRNCITNDVKTLLYDESTTDNFITIVRYNNASISSLSTGDNMTSIKQANVTEHFPTILPRGSPFIIETDHLLDPKHGFIVQDAITRYQSMDYREFMIIDILWLMR